jgi:hypothetical protein
MELLSKFRPGELIGLVAVMGVFLCGIVAIVTENWRKMRQITLKQDMVNRGMSAEEIRTILEAGLKRPRREDCKEHSSREAE